MKKIRVIISFLVSIFFVLLELTGISSYYKTKDPVELFLIIVIMIPMWFFVRSSLKHIKISRRIPEENNSFVSNSTDYGSLSVSRIQRKYGIEFNSANEIMKELQRTGYVGEENGYAPRKLLREENSAWEYIETNLSNNIRTQILNCDSMEGHQFEHFCADILKKNGFENVEVTRGSGDQGIDILATKDGVKYGIQCKCYSSDIGNKAVQEAFSGKTFYHCHVASVLTNRHFTASAKELAESNGVLLWDRDYLNKLIENAN